MTYTSTERRILVAAAGAPLRWRDGRGGTWLRTDVPAPLRAAALSLSEARVTAATSLLRLTGLLEAATTPEGPGLRITRAGLLAAGDVARGLLQEQRRGLRGLYRAGEAVQGERMESDYYEEPVNVNVWLEPLRAGNLGEEPRVICYGDTMARLDGYGLAIVIGSRALLTGGGRWAGTRRGRVDGARHARPVL